MKKSLISEDKVCWVCGTTKDICVHHIYRGYAFRKVSDEYGCWVYLCGRHHNLSNEGVHFNKELDLTLKKLCQEKFMKMYPELDFIKTFGRSYL